uniref:Putative secreted protein n=1 Tax=Amblyomma cajennense TaxID=34607 RepID=A0A023FBD7_AMBCJ
MTLCKTFFTLFWRLLCTLSLSRFFLSLSLLLRGLHSEAFMPKQARIYRRLTAWEHGRRHIWSHDHSATLTRSQQKTITCSAVRLARR